MGGELVSMLLSADELTSMRGLMARTYPETVITYKQVRTPDDSGGFAVVWDDQTPTIGRISPMAAGVGGANAEALIAARLGTAEAWLLTVPQGTDIDATDRVTLGGTRGFEVAVVLAPRTWELSRRVVVVELG